MRYRSFPRIPDLKLSVLGFGCMRLPTLGGDFTRIDEQASRCLIEHAIDAGVNYVDTAWPYHGGQSEMFLGRVLDARVRQRVLLATKLPVWLVNQESDWERLLDEQRARLQVTLASIGDAVIATDAPLITHQLNRLAKRAALGIGPARGPSARRADP